MDDCREDRDQFKRDNRLHEATIIILAYSWRMNAMDWIDEEIANLIQMSPQAMSYFVGSKTQAKSGIWYMEQSILNKQAAMRAKSDSVTSEIAINKILAEKLGSRFLDLYDVICAQTSCQVFTDTGFPIMFDEKHVTEIGAEYLARSVMFYRLIGIPLNVDPAAEPWLERLN